MAVRARTATGDPHIREKMDESGFPATKVIHMNDGIKALGLEGMEWAKAHYDKLSDYAHPNFSSKKVGISGGRQGTQFQYGASTLFSKEAGGITTYKYPSVIACKEALNGTCERVVQNAQHAFKTLETVDLPYSEEELLRVTGTRTGFTERAVQMPHADAASPPGRRVGRNDACPCGSGIKFKKCHGGGLH